MRREWIVLGYLVITLVLVAGCTSNISKNTVVTKDTGVSTSDDDAIIGYDKTTINFGNSYEWNNTQYHSTNGRQFLSMRLNANPKNFTNSISVQELKLIDSYGNEYFPIRSELYKRTYSVDNRTIASNSQYELVFDIPKNLNPKSIEIKYFLEDNNKKIISLKRNITIPLYL